MEDPGIPDALRALTPEEIDVLERFVHRLREDGWIRPPAAERWQAALDRTPARRPLRHAQG